MIAGAAAKRPVVFALTLLDRQIIDAGDAQTHQSVLVEFPVLVAVAAEPMATAAEWAADAKPALTGPPLSRTVLH